MLNYFFSATNIANDFNVIVFIEPCVFVIVVLNDGSVLFNDNEIAWQLVIVQQRLDVASLHLCGVAI